MINKIQKYLLLHFPTVWNIRIVPVLLIAAAIHLFFFGITYLSTDASFGNSYYSEWGDMGIFYFVSVVVAIVLLIGWLVHYMRNSAFAAYYPRKTWQLYVEWIMILVITSSLTFVPLSLAQGNNAKWRTAASEAEIKQAKEVLDKARVLIPSDMDNYLYDSERDKPIPAKNLSLRQTDSLSYYAFDYDRSGNIVVSGYIGKSLLYYNDYYYNSYSYGESDYNLKKRRSEKVKQWLRDGKQDSVAILMGDFIQLLDRHKLSHEMTVEKWMSAVYNPPFFPVSSSNAISKYSGGYYEPDLELPYYDLERGYEQIARSYESGDLTHYGSLICLCIAMCLSILIFSSRVTNMKLWLTAIVCGGLLILFSFLISFLASEVSSSSSDAFVLMLCFYWVMIFISLITYLYIRKHNIRNKGYSGVPMNLFLWMTPCIIPIMYFTILILLDPPYNYEGVFSEYNIPYMFWFNLATITIAMFPIIKFVRGWKGLPEE